MEYVPHNWPRTICETELERIVLQKPLQPSFQPEGEAVNGEGEGDWVQ